MKPKDGQGDSRVTPEMPLAIVALGANLGDTKRTLRRAALTMRAMAGGRFAAASLWRAEPVDCPPGSPSFLNSAVAFRTRLGPEALLLELQCLEAVAGRTRGEANAPRTLDLDLIDYQHMVIRTDFLTLPHPRAATRAFVLAPLVELDPELVLPGAAGSVSALLQSTDKSGLSRVGSLT